MAYSGKEYLKSPEKLREDIDDLIRDIGYLRKDIDDLRKDFFLFRNYHHKTEIESFWSGDIEYLRKEFEALRKALQKFPENTTP